MPGEVKTVPKGSADENEDGNPRTCTQSQIKKEEVIVTQSSSSPKKEQDTSPI